MHPIYGMSSVVRILQKDPIHALVLHLHGHDLATAAEPRAVHLRDRGRGQRLGVELGEDRLADVEKRRSMFFDGSVAFRAVSGPVSLIKSCGRSLNWPVSSWFSIKTRALLDRLLFRHE